MDDAPLATIYFDESGNAGENLLDKDQPAFTLASVFLDEGATDAIVAAVQAERRPGTAQNELKYSTLRKTARGQRALSAGLRAITPESAKVIEKHGFDIHASGDAPKIADLLYLRRM